MATTARERADGVMEVGGKVVMVPLTITPTHEIDVGTGGFRCPHCEDDHTFVIVEDRDTKGGDQGAISLRWPEEAWALAEFLLVEAFGAVSPGTWLAMKTMAALDAKDESGRPAEMMN